jgi:hypothetical protein
MIINVERCTRGTTLSIGPRENPLELKSERNPNRSTIKIESIHISCSSDFYNERKDFAGFLVYSYKDQQDFRLNGHHYRTGYTLIKE